MRTVPHIATDRRTADVLNLAQSSSGGKRWQYSHVRTATYLQEIELRDQISNVMKIDRIGVLFAQTGYLGSTGEKSGSREVPRI